MTGISGNTGAQSTMTSSRSMARKELLEDAHEGHEEYHPKARMKRIGPRRWMSMSESGYDYFETMMNWEPSRMQILGFLIILAVFVGILLCLLLLGPHFYQG